MSSGLLHEDVLKSSQNTFKREFKVSGLGWQVRLWNIPEQRVVDEIAVHEMVTALTFSADGARAVIGTLRGKCRFAQVAGGHLEYAAQMGELIFNYNPEF